MTLSLPINRPPVLPGQLLFRSRAGSCDGLSAPLFCGHGLGGRDERVGLPGSDGGLFHPAK